MYTTHNQELVKQTNDNIPKRNEYIYSDHGYL
jgi:hypothetical protein